MENSNPIEKQVKKNYTKKLVISAMLVALGVVLSRMLSADVMSPVTGESFITIGFGMAPILLLSVLYGPIWGGIGALLWDLIGALLFPKGVFNPMFTVAAFIFGVIAGLFFIREREPRPLRIFIACAISQLIYSLGLNSLIMIIMYAPPEAGIWAGIVLPRIIKNAIAIPVISGLVILLYDSLKRHRIIS